MRIKRREILQFAASGGLALVPPGLAPGAALSRTVEFTYEAQLSHAVNTSLWLPVPQTTLHQAIGGLRISGVREYQLRSGTHGNQYLFARLPAGSSSLVRLQFRATRSERTTQLIAPVASPADPRCCLAPDRLAPIDGKIQAWAREVVTAAKARTDLEKARAIYEHVVATVKYDKSGKGWGRGDIYYACDARRGNCSDFHAIFIGYARAVGIPAKFVIGVPLPSARGAGEIAGYHCWAEFFARDHGWIPVDASEAAKDPSRRNFFFGALDENRIEFTQGRDLVLEPKQHADPLNFFILAYAEHADHSPAPVTTRLHFRDLAPGVKPAQL